MDHTVTFNTITIHFHNFFSLFAKISITVYTIFLFTIRLKVLAFGGHMQCVFGHMCLNSWGGLPWKTRCPTTVLCTNVYVRMYVYVCLDSPNLRACPCYVRACVRTLTLISGARMQLLPAACTGHACARWQLFRENSSVKWQLPSYLIVTRAGLV